MNAPSGHSSSTPESSVSASHASAASARILCVGRETAQVVRIQLQLDADFEFALVSCAEDCNTILATEAPFDVIICDASIRELWGPDFLANLQAHSPDAERIVLASKMDPATREAVSRDARVMRIFLAPCPTMILREAVADALLRHRARALRAAFNTPAGAHTPISNNPVP